MVRLSLRVAASAILQKRERMKLRRRRATQRTENRVAPQIRIKENKKLKSIGRAMQGSITWVAAEIPLDILIEILTRLPAKSVLRFKCVSKFWSSLLSSRGFANRFLSVPSQPRLYMSLLDLYHNSKSLLLSSAPSTCPSSSSSLVFDQDLTIRKMGGFFLRVLRGFICSTVDLKPQIYNPTTRQLVILPAIQGSDILAEEDPYDILYFMGHDPVNDQFKLLCTITNMSNNDMQKIKSERWVLVVEAGGSWKRVAKELPPHLPNPFELNMNGFLYYLAWTDVYTCVLVSFDMRSEEFNMMVQVPRKAGDEMVPRVKKMVIQVDYGGKVAVFDYTYIRKSGTVDLWVLQDGRKEEWSRKTMVLQPCQLHLLNGNHRLIPKGTTLKDKVVLVPPNLVAPFYFLCYDLQTNDLKRVEVKGIPDRWFTKHDTDTYCDIEFMNPGESIQYLEA